MQHILFQENPNNVYKTAILIKQAALDKTSMEDYYGNPLADRGLNLQDLIGFSLKFNDQNKAPVKLVKEYLETLLPALDSLGVTTLVVADSTYYKVLTGQRKAEPHHGYIKPCTLKGFKHMNVILSINYQALFYNPSLQDKLTMSLNTLVDHIQGTHKELGEDIIHSCAYPRTLNDIQDQLDALYQYPALTCDIEAFSLDFHSAGIGTIAFAWDQHNGIAFPCDYSVACPTQRPHFGEYIPNQRVRRMLFDFFTNYKGKLIFHNAAYDVKLIIFYLYMGGVLQNNFDMQIGIEEMHEDIDDTKIITYLATNSTAGNDLKLKTNAFEFTGNYAKDDINDIRFIELYELLEYNLIDCLATWYVYNKNYPIMMADKQDKPYNTIFKPSMPVIASMELNGAPINMSAVLMAKAELQDIQQSYEDTLQASTLISKFEWQLNREAMQKANAELKTKVKPMSAFTEKFNPASNLQTQKLLYDYMGFPVIDTTDTNQPATGAKTIKKLLNSLINEYDITEEELNE